MKIILAIFLAKTRPDKTKACNLEVREDQEHLTVTKGYQDLKGDADLVNEGELVKFFNSVMERRELNEWN